MVAVNQGHAQCRMTSDKVKFMGPDGIFEALVEAAGKDAEGVYATLRRTQRAKDRDRQDLVRQL